MGFTLLSNWLYHHKRVWHSTVEDLVRRPLSALMTFLVIAISLALPATLLTLFNLGTQLTRDWQQETSITLFLKPEISTEEALKLSTELEEKAQIESVEIRTGSDALEEFRHNSGFGDALSVLTDNPLPNLLLIHTRQQLNENLLTSLLEKLQQLPQTDFVDHDQAWIQRLRSIIDFGHRLVEALAVALGIAVVLIISNTIRLEILNRREEIEITQLVGGTNSFIRRPFLYMGLVYGLLGGLFAWLLVSLLLIFLRSPLIQLENLYSVTLPLPPFELRRLLLLTGSGLILGFLGAWLAVARLLAGIQPD